MPAAFLFTYLFTRMSRRLNRVQIFYSMLTIFLGYYFVFTVYLFPNTDFFTLEKVASWLKSILPDGYRGFISMIKYWHVSLFYIFCEVWSSVIMFMIFWGFVNEITPMEKAVRFYPLYNLGGNLASTCAGFMLMQASDLELLLLSDTNANSVARFALLIVGITLILGTIAAFLFRYADRAHSQIPALNEKSKNNKEKSEKGISFTLAESLTQVCKSRYMMYLLILVVAYNLVFNLTDVLWSQQVKDYFGSRQIKMTAFIGKVTMYKGILSSGLVFAAHIIIKKWGWKVTTLVTPTIIAMSSILFFPLVYFQNSPIFQGMVAELFTGGILWATVVVGGLQNSLARGTKYSLYDTTREMAYIPLTTDMKRKGKAVIDGIASRIGKSSGSIFYMMILPFFGSLRGTVPVVGFLSVFVTCLWIYAVFKLNRLMLERKNKKSTN